MICNLCRITHTAIWVASLLSLEHLSKTEISRGWSLIPPDLISGPVIIWTVIFQWMWIRHEEEGRICGPRLLRDMSNFDYHFSPPHFNYPLHPSNSPSIIKNGSNVVWRLSSKVEVRPSKRHARSLRQGRHRYGWAIALSGINLLLKWPPWYFRR